MTYKKLSEYYRNFNFPVFATNEDGEFIIIKRGEVDNLEFYQTETHQNNNWIRVNTYWEDGTVEETYKR